MDLESGVGGCPPAATLTPRIENGSPSLKRLTSIRRVGGPSTTESRDRERSEEHTSELQSPCNLVCRLLLEKKKTMKRSPPFTPETDLTYHTHTPFAPTLAALPLLDLPMLPRLAPDSAVQLTIPSPARHGSV